MPRWFKGGGKPWSRRCSKQKLVQFKTGPVRRSGEIRSGPPNSAEPPAIQSVTAVGRELWAFSEPEFIGKFTPRTEMPIEVLAIPAQVFKPGDRVVYTPKHKTGRRESGLAIRPSADTNLLFVLYDGSLTPKATYIRDLELEHPRKEGQ